MSSSKPADLKVALIGLGKVSNAHLCSVGRLDGAAIVSVVEPNAGRRQEVEKDFGLTGFASLEDMLGEAPPDIACVLTPCATHAEICVALAKAGVHILCEKPLALSMDEAAEITVACEGAGVKFAYGSSYRFLPAIQKARSLIQQGVVGDVRLMRESAVRGSGVDAYTQMPPHHYPYGGPGGGGMGLVDHGIHLIDIFSWISGQAITSVMGRGEVSGTVPLPEYAILELDGGAVGTLVYDQSTFPSEMPWEGIFSFGRNGVKSAQDLDDYAHWDALPGSIHIHGTKGALRVFHYAGKVFLIDEKGCQEVAVEGVSAPLHFITQLQSFADGVASGHSSVGLDVGVRVLDILHKIYESSQTRAWVSVKASGE